MATPAGADPALHRAILAGDSAEVARLASLAASPQDLNLRDSDGMTPWHLATCAVRYSCLAPIVARVAALELASPRCAHLQPEATLRWARSSFSSMPAHGGTSAAPWDEDANEFQAAFLRQLSHAGPLVSLYVVFGGERGVEGRGGGWTVEWKRGGATKRARDRERARDEPCGVACVLRVCCVCREKAETERETNRVERERARERGDKPCGVCVCVWCV